jgi:putative endonuclease
MKLYYVYILASLSGTLYVGMTSTLDERAFQHKEKHFEGFTAKYGVDRLVYFEVFDNVHKAIAREKQIKRWRREKKVALIKRVNPQWKDLAAEMCRVIPKQFRRR